ncbi:MAG TPA: hypothetical protein VGJ48_19475 [Pyrinomonadaceae bacterium]
MKRVLISLAAGLLLIPFMLALLLSVKIFSPTNYPPAFLWLFLWPLPLLRLLCRITNLNVTAGSVLVVGLLGDYLLLSFLAYLCLTVRARLLKRKRLSSLPPPPVPFID